MSRDVLFPAARDAFRQRLPDAAEVRNLLARARTNVLYEGHPYISSSVFPCFPDSVSWIESSSTLALKGLFSAAINGLIFIGEKRRRIGLCKTIPQGLKPPSKLRRVRRG